MDATSLTNLFRQAVNEELERVQAERVNDYLRPDAPIPVPYLTIASDTDELIQSMIANATNNLMERKDQLQQSDSDFNAEVDKAVNLLKSFIHQVGLEASVYISGPYGFTAFITIDADALLRVKENFCPAFPLC
jgi:FKBP-type peptidyl-prolyl cis-trans isomerase (trigger factor)